MFDCCGNSKREKHQQEEQQQQQHEGKRQQQQYRRRRLLALSFAFTFSSVAHKAVTFVAMRWTCWPFSIVALVAAIAVVAS